LLYTSKVISNQAISASPRVTAVQRAKIKRSLSRDSAGIQATHPILNRFSKQAKVMAQTSSDDYQGYNRLLEGVVFGWERKWG